MKQKLTYFFHNMGLVIIFHAQRMPIELMSLDFCLLKQKNDFWHGPCLTGMGCTNTTQNSTLHHQGIFILKFY